MNITRSDLKLSWVSILLGFSTVLGCHSATSPTTGGNGNPSGTLYFNAGNGTVFGNDVIALDMSSGTTTRIIRGDDPTITSDHKIIFVDGDLKESDLQGMNVRTIAQLDRNSTTDNSHYSFGRPQVSQDGRFVAYQESKYTDQVYVVNRSDGSLAATVIANPGTFFTPSWTQGGSVVVEGGSTNPGLWITSTTANTQIPGAEIGAGPRTDPTGTKIAFTRNGDVYTINVDGSSVKKIVSDGKNYSTPVWSPDGKYLAFVLDAHLVYADIATGTVHNLEDVYPNILNNFHNQITTGRQMDWK